MCWCNYYTNNHCNKNDNKTACREDNTNISPTGAEIKYGSRTQAQN